MNRWDAIKFHSKFKHLHFSSKLRKSGVCVCAFGVFVCDIHKDDINLLETAPAHLFTFDCRDAENCLTATQTTFAGKLKQPPN